MIKRCGVGKGCLKGLCPPHGLYNYVCTYILFFITCLFTIHNNTSVMLLTTL